MLIPAYAWTTVEWTSMSVIERHSFIIIFVTQATLVASPTKYFRSLILEDRRRGQGTTEQMVRRD